MKKTVAVLMAAACIFVLAGCGEKMYTDEFFAMQIVVSQNVYGDEDVLYDNEADVCRIDEEMSKSILGSDIYALNHAGGHEMQVSDETYSVLKACMEAAEETEGAFDPTIGGVVELWGFGTEYEGVPGERMLESVLRQTGYENVTLGDDNMVGIGNTQIDLGGAAKGYALDAVEENIVEAGVESALVSIGGSIYARGAKPDGEKWKIGVRDPFGDLSQYMCVIELEDEKVSTSGIYERGFEQDGEYYHHILDPDTGYPVDNGLVSVSVIDENGLTTDIYSTALFVMGLEKGLELANSKGLDAMFITQDKNVYLTDGFGHNFELKDNSFHVQ